MVTNGIAQALGAEHADEAVDLSLDSGNGVAHFLDSESQRHADGGGLHYERSLRAEVSWLPVEIACESGAVVHEGTERAVLGPDRSVLSKQRQAPGCVLEVLGGRWQRRCSVGEAGGEDGECVSCVGRHE